MNAIVDSSSSGSSSNNGGTKPNQNEILLALPPLIQHQSFNGHMKKMSESQDRPGDLHVMPDACCDLSQG